MDECRKQFELLMKAPPFEMHLERHTDESSWPGNYKSYSVQLAWCAWSELWNHRASQEQAASGAVAYWVAHKDGSANVVKADAVELPVFLASPDCFTCRPLGFTDSPQPAQPCERCKELEDELTAEAARIKDAIDTSRAKLVDEWAEKFFKQAERLAAALCALKPFSDAFAATGIQSYVGAENGFVSFLDRNEITPSGPVMGDFRTAWETVNGTSAIAAHREDKP